MTPSHYAVAKGCSRKKRYSTEALAEKVARKVKYERGDDCRAYFCELCGGFHLTKKPKEGQE